MYELTMGATPLDRLLASEAGGDCLCLGTELLYTLFIFTVPLLCPGKPIYACEELKLLFVLTGFTPKPG